MKKESYKDFIYLKIPKDEWEKIEKTALEKGKHIKQLSYENLLEYKFAYEL